MTAVARSVLAETIFLEIALANFGPSSMIRGEHGFFPHIFMPAYDGPWFDEAVRRIVLPDRGPNILYFSITGVCPCHCEYCFAGAGGTARDRLGDEPVLEVARKVAALRVPLFNLSGGEPLSRYDRLLEAVRLLSEGSEVRMFTTGIGLTEARLEALRAAGLKGMFVSLDTDDPAGFDAARGRDGAFAAATAALHLASEAGMLTFVNCVVEVDAGLQGGVEDEPGSQQLQFVAVLVQAAYDRDAAQRIGVLRRVLQEGLERHPGVVGVGRIAGVARQHAAGLRDKATM